MQDLKFIKKNIALIFSLICLIIIGTYLFSLRNDLYGFFYNAINAKQNIIKIIFNLSIIAGIISLNNFLKGIVKTKFISINRKENFNQFSFIQNSNETEKDFAQRISEDQRTKAKYLITTIEYFSLAFFTFIIFIPKMFILMKENYVLTTSILLFYSLFVLLINFGILKKILQNRLYNFEEHETNFRNFLSLWLNKKSVKPVSFATTKLLNARKYMEKYYITNEAIAQFKDFYLSIGLVIPFYIFYNTYENGKIDFGTFMQLINIWTAINVAINNIASSIEEYICFDITKKRLKHKNHNKVKCICNNSIKFKNITININNEKILIKNFSLDINKGEKINIISKNGTGKTTLMNAMQGFHEFSGNIEIPKKNIAWIPEQPIFSAQENNLNLLNDNHKFLKSTINLKNKTDYKNLSGAEKWKVLKTYSMQFETIIWDDPCWGLNYNEELQNMLKSDKTILIFSSEAIKNMKHVKLI